MGNKGKRFLSPLQCVAYGLANNGHHLINMMVSQWGMAYYIARTFAGKPLEGGPYTTLYLFAIAILVGRIVGAITNPAIGYISDNIKTKLGRRLPFIIIGSLFLVTIFIFLWFPPKPSVSIINFFYLTIILGLIFFFFSIVDVPYVSLLPNLARTDKERIGLAMYQNVLSLIYLCGFTFVVPKLIDYFGFKVSALILSAVAFICYLPMVFTIRERKDVLKNKKGQLKIGEALKITLTNRPFLIYVITFSLVAIPNYALLNSVSFFVRSLIGGSEKDIMWYWFSMLPGMVFTFILLFFFALESYKKENILLFSLLLMTVFYPMIMLIGKIDNIIPANILGFIPISLLGIPLLAILLILPAIFGDIIDYDEKKTGQRREGIYTGVQSFLQKIAIAISSLIVAFLFSMFGFSRENPEGIRLLGPFASFFSFLAFLVFRHYPATK